MKQKTNLQREQKRFASFVLVGGFAALVNILARIVASNFMNFQIAVVLAYLIGMVTAFTLSRLYVFDRTGRSVREELTKFTIVNMVALGQVWAVTMLLNYYVLPAIGWTFHPELFAHVAGVASPVFTSYLGHKHFSFRSSPPKKPMDE